MRRRTRRQRHSTTSAAGTEDRDEDDALRVLAIKGYASPDAIAAALRSPLDVGQGLLDHLIAEGLAEPGAGAFRLTETGRDARRRPSSRTTPRPGASTGRWPRSTRSSTSTTG